MFSGLKNDGNAFSQAQQKTAFAVATTKQSFAIHVDPQPSIATTKPKAKLQELNPALTTLSRPALTDVFVSNTPVEGKLVPDASSSSFVSLPKNERKARPNFPSSYLYLASLLKSWSHTTLHLNCSISKTLFSFRSGVTYGH